MPKTSSLPSAFDAPASHEQARAELESGQLPLERLLQGSQRGAQLLEHCRARPETVAQQVKVLEDGQLKPWMEP